MRITPVLSISAHRLPGALMALGLVIAAVHWTMGQTQARTLIATLNDVEDLLERGELSDSLPEFLQSLSYPLHENYVLIHTSRSLQPASPLNPRVVMYHPDTQLTLAYTGDESQIGRPTATIEMIQYNPSEADFTFAELDFSGPEPSLTINPASCTTCHTPSLRPNWFTYPLWPGAYDARDTSRPTSTIEVAHFPQFLATAGDNPFYRILVDLEGYFARSPSTSFNDYLNPMNKAYIGAELTRTQHFGAFRYALVAALSSSCGANIEEYLPVDLRASHFPKSHATFKSETNSWMQAAYERRFDRYVELNEGVIGDYPYTWPPNFLMQGYYRHQVSSLRYMLDQQGPAAHRLFFALDQQSFQTPWASALISARIPGVAYENCRDLEAKSHNALKDWRELGLTSPSWNL